MTIPVAQSAHWSRKPEKIDLHVGKRLRSLRLMRNFSQEALAEKVGLTFQQVQKYEKGVNRVSASRLQQFANVLDVKPQFFFDSDEDYSGHTSDASVPLGLIDDRDIAAVVHAFRRISDTNIRRAIVEHVRSLAAYCAETRPK